jgi:hypothetical protein
MKSQLSHLMPVAKAIKILEVERVERIVQNLLSWQRQPPNQQTAISPSPLLANPTPRKPTNEEDAHHLVQAMLYSASSTSSSIPDSPHQQHLNSNLPPPIRLAWKRIFSRSLMLDKISFLRFAVPASAQPHAGPGGHMGLFDCLFYALQQKASSPVMGGGAHATSPANSLGASSAAGLPLISIPDFCIFLAICKAYMDLQNGTSSTSDATIISPNTALDPAIVQMSQWMFIVYDSYQKKNLISRDTLHRFLSDVHGEDSYKKPMIRDLLNVLFVASSAQTNREFVLSIGATMTWEPRPSHVLLDWMGVLGQAILPPLAIPESTAQFLQTIEQEINWLPQVCSKFGLAENRFYEIKRRFHSLVESASTVIHGDPMQEEGGVDDSHAGAAADAQQPNNNTSNNNAASNRGAKQQPQLPKNAVSFRGFLKAVNPANDEQGHGGYLPVSLATKMFNFKKVKMAGLPPTKSPGSDGASVGKKEGMPHFWDLTHVLQFGGMAVRADSDAPLVRWIAELYGTSFLCRREIGELLLGLIDHHLFRIEAESPPSQRDVHMTEEAKTATTNGKTGKEDVETSEHTADEDIEQQMVDTSAALSLGLVPKKQDSPSKATSNGLGTNKADKGTPAKIALSVLIDQVLKEVGSSTGTASVTDLVAWHGKGEEASSTEGPATQRLGPLMLELRLIASVLFGIPPKSAAMELGIVSEIQRRHRCRYPQTDVSRRGPRGTVWYIVDDLWYRTWNGLIQKVSKTPEDGEDLRDNPLSETTPRRLGCINNKGLLRENGSLALRVDIKWRHDYEIIPPLAWSALQAWYDGGPPIHRSVVPYVPPASSSSPHVRSNASRIRTENEIELYPFFVTIFMCDSASRGDARPFQQAVPVSRVTPLQVLTVQLCKGLDVDPKYGRLWMMESAGDGTVVSGSFSSGGMAGTSESSLPVPGQGDWLLDLSQNIVDQRKNRPGSDQSGNNIILLLELKDPETGLWPRGVDGKQWTFRDKLDPNVPDMGDGVVGLYNMGNTCYLNSSIQCLSHTPIFRDYFTSKCYLNDINTTNPLGHQGRLAQVSAVLINSLWKRFNNQAPHQPKRVTAPGSYAPVNAPALTPKTFKESLGKFNEIFSGNEQHDAQELLAFLLGGLSEDLNRIVEKPYIEAPDSDGRPDSELADIWWSNHLKREMSIIVALFTGQYKSLLACRSCKYESARFEPFSFLQLPLPEDDHISVSLILYPIHEGAETMRYSVRVLNNGKLYDVLIALAKVLHVDEQTEAHAEDDAAEASPKLPDPIDDEKRKKLDDIYEERAQNMAVVDMRDGYIFKIAPVRVEAHIFLQKFFEISLLVYVCS